MNPEAVLAVLPNSKEDALTLEDIALALALDTSSYTAMGRTNRQLSRALRSLIRWGWVTYDIRQSENDHRAWHNAYWKTRMAGSA